MRRRVTHELLDDDLGTLHEIASSLVDLRHINGWFGGTRTSVDLMRRVAAQGESRKLSLLEVGAGAGDVPMAMQRALAHDGYEVAVVLLDRVAGHLPAGPASIVGDALRLPFRDDAFDVVSCSLLAHHFDPDEVAQFAREALRVSRRAVIINDLVRSPVHLALVYAGLPLFHSRMTWHDAPASVRQAYTCEEMRRMLEAVPASRVEIATHYLYRMGVLLWK